MWKDLHKLVAGVAAVSLGLAAGAQDLPAPPSSLTQRPIELVVPWGTGGGSDQMARALAQAMEKVARSVKIAVVNKPGGNGTLGLTHALSQPANGRSLALITNDFLINHVSGSASIKPDDFEYVGRVVADVEMLFARSSDARFPNFGAYVKEAKTKPGGLTIATAGASGIEQMAMTLVNKALGIEVKWLPFDKPAERIAAFLGGHVDLMVEEPSDMKQHITEGKMKPLVQLTEQRTANFPDTPTAKELGADVTMGLWRGVAIKAATEAGVRNYLEKLVAKAVADPEFVSGYVRARSLDIRPGYLAPADFKRSVSIEHEAIQRILKGK